MSTTLVVDASVLVDALCLSGERGDLARAALTGATLAGPEHLRVETFQVIRKLVHQAAITPEAGTRSVERLRRLAFRTVVTAGLLDRMWELRGNLTGYDAAYVAAAERLGVTLITRDGGILAAPNMTCSVRRP